MIYTDHKGERLSKWECAHLDTAVRFSELSSAIRLKVGAIIVKTDAIISIGYNGTPPGWDNSCEELVNGVLATKAEVIHAEENAIMKLTKAGVSPAGGDIYITHAPCIHCARLIAGSGIKRVYYIEPYRDTSGISHLVKRDVEVVQCLI